MTIIAGFKSQDGIVLCADTQETMGPMKRNVPKLRWEPSEGWVAPNDGNALAVAFCGAGHGPFIDKLVEVSWQAAKNADSLDGACNAIERRIKDHYEEFGKIYQVGSIPEVELIFGVKMYQESKLFSAVGPVVNEVRRYWCSGVGVYLADFLASRMYGSYLTAYQCVILAAYILFQAEEHVDGCGGHAHVAILRENGPSGMVDWPRIEAITRLLRSTDEEFGRLLLHSADLGINDNAFREKFDTAKRVLEALRNKQKKELEKWDEVDLIMGHSEGRDSLGFKPLDARKSKPKSFLKNRKDTA